MASEMEASKLRLTWGQTTHQAKLPPWVLWLIAVGAKTWLVVFFRQHLQKAGYILGA